MVCGLISLFPSAITDVSKSRAVGVLQPISSEYLPLQPFGLELPFLCSGVFIARTRVPCIGRQTLNHCATREAPVVSNILFGYFVSLRQESKFNPFTFSKYLNQI